jgi:hypothetical protein
MNHRTHQSTSTQQQRISNFLYPTETLDLGHLPQHFLDFCRRSIESVKGDIVYADPILRVPPTPDYEAENILNLETPNGHLVKLEPIESERPVVAVDTSTIKLGELEDGTLCALRGAIVWLEQNRYRYARYGPLVFSLGHGSNPKFEEFADFGLTPFTGETNVDNVLKRVRNVLERWLQFNVSSTIRNGIILIDGSLTAGTPDNPAKELERILHTARQAGNTVIAISKKTKLRIQNQSITDLLENKPDPCLLDVDEEVSDQFPPYPVRFLGRVFVAKLAKRGFPFRTDVDRGLTVQDTLKSIRELTGTDIVDQGYPETLRMAHILSTFTASDVLAMQIYTATHFGVQLTPKLLLRRSLFGPFGTAWEAYH